MPRTLEVYGRKTFRVVVPDGAAVTFGPWSPPTKVGGYNDAKALTGTLRIYEGAKTTSNVIAVFSGVEGFRDLNLQYNELVAREEGAAIWKSDETGYSREEKAKSEKVWVNPLLESGTAEVGEDEEKF